MSGMFSILVSKIKESQLTVTSLAFGNSHRLVTLKRSPMCLFRDKLAIGIIERGTKGKLLLEKSLTLDKAIDSSNEITRKQLETMKSDAVTASKEEVNFEGKEKGNDYRKPSSGNSKHKRIYIPGKKKPKADPGNTRKCKNCGSQQKRSECPTYNKHCAYCQKWNHFASVCMARKKVWPISYKKISIVEIQSQFSKWKMFRL